MKRLKMKIAVFLLVALGLSFCTDISVYAADDYPADYKNAAQDALVDEWNFYNRECTSFVAWCLNSRNGVPFTNRYNGVHWGNANNWGNAARQCGFTVDMTPKKGSVYWSDSGAYGHVAWVSEVNGNSVRIEEYNHLSNPGGYHERVVDVSTASGYIHIKDISEISSEILGSHIDQGGKQSVMDGDYHIVCSDNLNQCLDIENASKDNEANAWIFNSVTDSKQVFTVRYLGNGFYSIMNKHSGKYLDVQGAGLENKTNVWQYEKNGSDAQQWAIYDAGDQKSFWIQSRCNGFYLDRNNAETKNKTNVQVHVQNGTEAQKWLFIPWGPSVGKTISNGTYSIVATKNKKMALSTEGNKTSKETTVLLGNNSKKAGQVYDVKYLGDGYYSITNKKSGLCLDVDRAAQERGTNVKLYTKNGSDAQKWIIKPSGNGSYNIISKCNGRYLDIVDNKISDRTKVWIYDGNGTDAQEWSFKRIL